ncbi:MAG: SDR family NAD(P)-dependent oxidoreductase [Acetobacteraceae bacterium]
MRLKDRRILVTGAASGIGLAVARAFHAEGAFVGLLDRDAAGLAAALGMLGARAAQAVADVFRRGRGAGGCRADRQQIGGLDGVVSCAGIDLVRPFADTAADEWMRVMNVNLNGPYHVCRAALPFLRQAGSGTIVMVASGAALRPLEQRTAYCCSKAGLVMFSKALAMDLADDHIRVNAICPGIIDTPMFSGLVSKSSRPASRVGADPGSLRHQADRAARGYRPCRDVPDQRRVGLCDGVGARRRWRADVSLRAKALPTYEEPGAAPSP